MLASKPRLASASKVGFAFSGGTFFRYPIDVTAATAWTGLPRPYCSRSRSTKIDSALASMTGADAKVAADFKAVWDQFTATRDAEIIPAIDKGNFEDAKKLADGIQFQRLSRMWSIMSCSR